MPKSSTDDFGIFYLLFVKMTKSRTVLLPEYPLLLIDTFVMYSFDKSRNEVIT
jgi:hypothetical protein